MIKQTLLGMACLTFMTTIQSAEHVGDLDVAKDQSTNAVSQESKPAEMYIIPQCHYEASNYSKCKSAEAKKRDLMAIRHKFDDERKKAEQGERDKQKMDILYQTYLDRVKVCTSIVEGCISAKVDTHVKSFLARDNLHMSWKCFARLMTEALKDSELPRNQQLARLRSS